MPLPVTFFNLPAGDNPASLLDEQFAALAGFVVIPCSANGQNDIQLTPFLDAPVVNGYNDLSPLFAFAASETCDGNVTLNVAGLGAYPAYKANGAAFVEAGDLLAGLIYQASYFSGLDNGAGGFVINVGGGGGGGPPVVPGGPDVANVIMSTYTGNAIFTPGPNLIAVIVEGMGGGGGGGNASVPGAAAGGGGGGASGGYFKAYLTPAQVGPSQSITIGAGGGAQAAGGQTTFGSLCTASGGQPGQGNDSNTIWGNPGNGGIATLASGVSGLSFAGMPGAPGETNQGAVSPDFASVFSGAGGHIFGGAGAAQQVNSVLTGVTNGAPASPNSGAGGSGAASSHGGGTGVGGNGANGWLQLTAYYSA